ncbi:MAG: alkaline phosphatase family protein [Candidatus Alcyoniella australis]|nr:alkaline phosphatase family protein [Candidatus Alcyoniella australis]
MHHAWQLPTTALICLLLAACAPQPLPPQGHVDPEPLDHGYAVGWQAPSESKMPQRQIPQVQTQPIELGSDSQRVVVLGLDGADWRILEPLMAAGLLPNFERLLAAGAAGVLQTDHAFSPTSWTTIATGKVPVRHGVTPDYKLSWGAMALEPQEINVRRVWEMARDRQRTIAVFDYYFSRPRAAGNWGYIPDLGSADDQLLPAGLSLEGCYNPEAGELEHLFQKACIIGRRPMDLSIILVQQTDVAAHKAELCWLRRWHPEMFADDPQVAQLDQPDRLSATWIGIDRALGYLWQRMPSGAHLVICSDHGFGVPQATHLHAGLGHGTLAALALDRERIEQQPAGLEFRLGQRRLRATRSYDFQAAHLAHFKWREGPETTWLVREQLLIEPAGRTAPGWIDAVRTDLQSALGEQSALLEFQNVEDRGLLVRPAVDATLSAACRLQTPQQRDAVALEFTCAHHNPGDDGVMLIVGPKVKPGARIQGARLVDVTPTVLYLLGLPVGQDLDGRVLSKAFEPAALAVDPVRFVATYETSPPQRDPISLAEITLDSPQMTPELLERLRSLGYLQ